MSQHRQSYHPNSSTTGAAGVGGAQSLSRSSRSRLQPASGKGTGTSTGTGTGAATGPITGHSTFSSGAGAATATHIANPNISGASTMTTTAASNRGRQYAHLHAALAQLNAHLADTDNLLRMTAVQAEYMRGLAGCTGGLFMAAAKVLGEDKDNATVVSPAKNTSATAADAAATIPSSSSAGA